MTTPWTAGPTSFRPSDIAASTRARGFGRSVAELDPRLGAPLAPIGAAPPRADAGDVVVTGGAGFLGARVVLDLLASLANGRIHVCSRNPRMLDGPMEAMIGRHGARRLSLDERIAMVPVDLSVGDAVDRLATHVRGGRVRTVVHLAAAVDAFAPRERLAAANETATRNAIAFAASVGARLVHASTLSAFVSSDMGGEDRETSLRDHPERMLFGGYAQTKAVADMLVEDAAAAGLDACSVRLGLLVPERRASMEEGSFVSSFRRALGDVGAVPATAEEALVDLTPVHQAATCLVALADADRVPAFVHYASPRGASLSMVVRAVLGDAPRILDDGEWDRLVSGQPSIRRALLEAAFRKSRFLAERCASRPLANADLFQSTARTYDPTTAVRLGAPVPRDPETVCASLFGGDR
jgi:nucleoside-diphosphate-sugar epimerase